MAYRDYSREHPEVAHEYEKLKCDLDSRYLAATIDSRQAYSDAKTAFVTRVTDRLSQWDSPMNFIAAPSSPRLQRTPSAAPPSPLSRKPLDLRYDVHRQP